MRHKRGCEGRSFYKGQKGGRWCSYGLEEGGWDWKRLGTRLDMYVLGLGLKKNRNRTCTPFCDISSKGNEWNVVLVS